MLLKPVASFWLIWLAVLWIVHFPGFHLRLFFLPPSHGCFFVSFAGSCSSPEFFLPGCSQARPWVLSSTHTPSLIDFLPSHGFTLHTLLAPTRIFPEIYYDECLLDLTTWMSNKDLLINMSKNELPIFTTKPPPPIFPILVDNRLHFFFHSSYLIIQKMFLVFICRKYPDSDHFPPPLWLPPKSCHHPFLPELLNSLQTNLTASAFAPLIVFSQPGSWSDPLKNWAGLYLFSVQNSAKTSSNAHWQKCWNTEMKNTKRSSYLHGAPLQAVTSTVCPSFSTKKLSGSGLLYFTSVNILGWTILYCEKLTCAS